MQFPLDQTRIDRLSKEIQRSFEESPYIKIRLICFYSGNEVHHFADEMEKLQNAGKIPNNVEVQRAVGSTPENWERRKKEAVDSITSGKSVIIPATDYRRDLYNTVLDQCNVKEINILDFGYDEE